MSHCHCHTTGSSAVARLAVLVKKSLQQMLFKKDDDLCPRAAVNDAILNDVWDTGERDRHVWENTPVSTTVT